MSIQQESNVKVALTKLVDYFSNPNLNLPFEIAKTYLKSYGKPSDKWSLNNQLIMRFVGNTSDARTYVQWQSVGRQVQKGQKGFYIIAPNIFTKKVIDEKTGQEKTVSYMNGFKICPSAMFAIHQTKGKDVKYIEVPKQVPPLMDVAERLGLKVSYDRTIGGEYGSYNPETDEIRLCTDDIGTFFHELAHAVHKKINGKLKGGQDTEQETIAEFTSCVLASMYGYDKKSYTYNYIKSYSEDKEKVGEQIIKVISTVEKILNYIFGVEKKD